MAGKEGVFLILDVGKSMSKQYSDTEMTRLDFGIESIRQLIRQKLLFSAKKDQIGIILVGSDSETNDAEYIEIAHNLSNPVIQDIHNLKNIKTSNEDKGDIFESIDIAIDVFIETYKKLKWVKKIFLITDGESKTETNSSKIKRLAEKLEENNVNVNVICVDFYSELDEDEVEEEDGNIKEKDDINMDSNESENQKKTKKYLKELSESTENVKLFTSTMANYIYHQFKKKKINPTTKFRGPLIITPNLSLDIMVYTKTSNQTIPSLKKYSLVAEYSNDLNTCQVVNDRLYYVHDDPQQNPISKEFIAKAYYYGNSLVPVSKTDEIRFKNEENKCLKTIGFTDSYRVPRHAFMSGVDLVIPNPQSENDIKAMKALVEEMIKMNKVLIARYVYRNNSSPKLVVLSPHLSKKGPLFYLNVLPTVEDIRDYQFDSLKECTKNQEELISKFIDSLDLENDDEEELKPTETYNPTLQYFYQCLESKALNNEDEIPPLDDEISKYLVPNKKLFENNKYVSFLPKLFPIKEKDKIDEKKKRIFWKDVINEEFENKLTQERMEEKLNSKKKESKKTISTITPIEDFKEMIGNKNEDLTVPAMILMSDLIHKFIRDSFKGSYYIKAIECIKVYRDAANEEDEVELFNNFLNDLKVKYPKEQFLDFWLLFSDNNITLISKSENPKSTFSDKEADEWLGSIKKKEVITSTIQDMDNLLLDID